MVSINQLPYFQTKNKKETNLLASFLLRKMKKKIQKNPYHHLIFARQDKRLKYIQELSKKYRYFLKIVEKYYPSINHAILLKNLNSTPELQTRRMKLQLKNQIPSFLRQGPITDKGLPLGNYLAWILAGFYLLPLDFKIPRPFLRVQDDYLVFCKKIDEAQKILKEIIIPELERLKLNISIKKLKSGKFHQDKVNFLGFNFYAGYFTIHPNKKEEFKKRIIKITYLTNKKKEKAVIKLLNNKILGFGYYYKQSTCKRDFEELDAFIRMRLRRWFLKQKELLPKQSNLVLSNEVLKKMGLKSLLEIKNKFELKKSSKKKKTNKKERKNGKIKSPDFLQLEKISDKYLLKQVLIQLTELASLVKKQGKEIQKIRKKLER